MASPQQPYTDGAPDPEGQDGSYQQDQAGAAPATGAKKKRDRYAGQAYEFGAGANAALGGQQAGGQPVQSGGYGFPGQQSAAQQPSYGMPQPQQPQYPDPSTQNQAQPQYGQPQYGAQQGGYQPPQDGYQPPGQQPGVQGVTQQFQQMSVAGQPPQAAGGQMRLNPLQPVDIGPQGQPFHVTDLDQPPPPIVLPPNVCCASQHEHKTLLTCPL